MINIGSSRATTNVQFFLFHNLVKENFLFWWWSCLLILIPIYLNIISNTSFLTFSNRWADLVREIFCLRLPTHHHGHFLTSSRSLWQVIESDECTCHHRRQSRPNPSPPVQETRRNFYLNAVDVDATKTCSEHFLTERVQHKEKKKYRFEARTEGLHNLIIIWSKRGHSIWHLSHCNFRFSLATSAYYLTFFFISPT